jgi:hypothetical protein
MTSQRFKSVIAGVSLTILGVAPTAAIASAANDNNNGNSNAQNKVTICHATGSQTNPYVKISPDANGVISGHVNHQDTRDIIPPFDYNDHGTTKSFPGQNWDANGQAIFNNGCVVATTGGQGGGTTNNQQTTTPNSVSAGGQGAGQSQAPQGSVNAGEGGASDFSITTLQRVW